MIGKYYRKGTELNNIKRHNNNNNARTAPVMPMAGAIVIAAILLSGLSLIGSYPQQLVTAQQEGMMGTGGGMTDEGGGATRGGNATANMTRGAAQGNDSMSQVRMHLEEARTALQNNDTQGTLMHLDLALDVLGNGNASGISTNITTGTNAIAGDITPNIGSENPVQPVREASSANDDDEDDNDDAGGSSSNTDDEDRTERDTDEEVSEDVREASSANDDDEDDNDDAGGSSSNTDDEDRTERDTDEEVSECGAVNIGGTSPADDYGCPPDDDGA